MFRWYLVQTAYTEKKNILYSSTSISLYHQGDMCLHDHAHTYTPCTTHTHHSGSLFIMSSPLCPDPSQGCKSVPPNEYICSFYSLKCIFNIPRRNLLIILMFLFILCASQLLSGCNNKYNYAEGLVLSESQASL